MTTTLKAPPYVLAHPGDTSGCGFHRILRPMEIMIRNGVLQGRPDLQFLPDDALRALRPDVIVWQRQSGPEHLAEMRRYRAALPNAFFVYELDDAMGAVPDKSWHKPYMMPGVDDRVAEAVKECDAVTVTTDGLARYMRKLCGDDIDIRVVPNMLGKDDLHNADMVRQQVPKPDHPRIRIGWGGGIGHKGDLDLLHDAMIALKDEVTWVFLGMNPDIPEGVEKQFMGAAPPHQYLMALAALRVDLVVAPIEDNEFNHSKSNLRLLEAGACMYPVLASPVEPYFTDKPPVVAHVPNDGWEAAIRDFMKKDAKQRLWHAERMRRWVEHNYVMDDRAAERASGWLPNDVQTFVPSMKKIAHAKNSTAKAIVVSHTDLGLDIGPTVQTINDALALGGELDILYVRKSTNLTREQALKMLEPCGPDVATVSVLTNDGGPLGFPVMGTFIPLDKMVSDKINELCHEMTDGQTSGMDPTMPACAGPVIVLRRQAFSITGEPEVREGDWDEISVIEWSAMASARGMRSVACLGAFVTSDEMSVFPQQVIQESVNRMRMRYQQGKFDQQEIDMFRERLELLLHRETYTTGNPTNPTDYAAWVEMRDTIGPTSRKAMMEWVTEKERPVVEVLRYSQEGDILASIDNHADWVIFVSGDARVPVHLVPAFLDKIDNDQGGCSIIYADHDYLTPEGQRQGHDFKPEFDHHMLVGRDYVTTVFAVKVADIAKLKRKPTSYGPAQAQLYDLVLSMIETFGPVAMSHLDHILASIPVPDMAQLNVVTAERVKLADAHVKRLGWPARVDMHSMAMGLMALTYMPKEHPLVSIIIPTRDNLEMILPCVQTILSMTIYPKFEVVIVDNGSVKPEVIEYYEKIEDEDDRVRVLHTDMAFNWSAINNWATHYFDKYAERELFVFLNDDTRVLAPQWLDQMVGASQVPDVGAVGAKLIYPHGGIQHIGVLADNGVTTHFHKGQSNQFVGYHGIAAISREATAVTGACMLVSRKIFNDVGGFPEELANNFNDVVFCLRVRDEGLVNVVAMQAELQHIEGASRVTALTEAGRKILLDDGEVLKRLCPARDPYWNDNLAIGLVNGGIYVTGSNMDILNWKERPWPWDTAKSPKRILHLGHPAVMGHERHDGHAIYDLEVNGFAARIGSPPMGNVRSFDIRDPSSAESVLRLMEFDEIVVTQLGNAPLLTLSFLTRLNVPVTYRPIDGEAVCPRRNFEIADGVSCDKAWRNPGACQGCIDQRGSPNGYVVHMAWMAEWMRFLGGQGVAFDLRFLDDEARTAFEGVFIGDAESIQAA